ncbi:copper resistance CopC family protein [Pseudokineococcus marinus]|uniref:Copper resistance protein CopC n=1 Tax=Pseudokineococcus marinus TaxID=351215 RepID=A0A849BGZ8_9ACTN|nr:copper resistance CopC family protein [Pseudokineococcus marinus]NNH21841.1 copper resistance protein CopC [Pseudokineococcus marinus]
MTTRERTRTTHRAGRRAAGAAAGVLAAGLVVVAAPAAWAHDRLVGSDPESGAVLDAVPAEAVLTFSSEVQELGTVLELQGADGSSIAGETVVAGRDVSLPLPSDLPSGEYAVVYRVTSSDGHPISGEVPFSLEVAAPATPAPSASPSPSPSPAASPTATSSESAGVGSSPSPTTAAGAADVAEPASAESGDDVPWAPIVVVLVVVVLGGLAAAVLGRRRGPRTR